MKESPSLDELLPVGGRRVLIVEDEAFVREGLVRLLEGLGWAVDPRSGVDLCDLPLSGYDAAFLDNYFESSTLTGVSLVGPLRASCPGCRIVAMSSDAGKNAEMLRLGADLAVAKSVLRRLV